MRAREAGDDASPSRASSRSADPHLLSLLRRGAATQHRTASVTKRSIQTIQFTRVTVQKLIPLRVVRRSGPLSRRGARRRTRLRQPEGGMRCLCGAIEFPFVNHHRDLDLRG